MFLGECRLMLMMRLDRLCDGCLGRFCVVIVEMLLIVCRMLMSLEFLLFWLEVSRSWCLVVDLVGVFMVFLGYGIGFGFDFKLD